MSAEVICSFQEISKKMDEHQSELVTLEFLKGRMYACISSDDTVKILLKMMSGLAATKKNQILFAAEMLPLSRGERQYVPDDIVCYYNMKVRQFLLGIAMRYGKRKQDILQEGIRLCQQFDIPLEEELLNLTFEQNRIVTIIQGIMVKPKLLLVDHGRDLLETDTYLQMCKELKALQQEGTTILMAVDNYEQLDQACDEYLFFQEGELIAQYVYEEIPRPYKVVSMVGGSLQPFTEEKMEFIYDEDFVHIFLYKETNMRVMSECIAKTKCLNYNVEELSMEEHIFKQYDRWIP